MRRTLFFILFLFSLGAQAQTYELPRVQISLSYFGEMITHTGIRIGVTTPIKQSLFGDDNQINKAWVVGGYLTYYKHPRNHNGVMLTGAIGRQRIGASGLHTEINFEAGYMLSTLDGEAYEWNESEIVTSGRSSSHMVLGFNGGVGWNFAKKSNVPLTFLLNPHLYIQAPYNTLFVPRMALETKLIYHFN